MRLKFGRQKVREQKNTKISLKVASTTKIERKSFCNGKKKRKGI